MDDAVRTMIQNLPDKTGKSLDEWLAIVAASKLEKHGQIMKLLKGEHGVTHGFANLIAHQARERAAGGRPADDDLVAGQYAKKPALRPIFDALMAKVAHLDFQTVPKKTAVALKRNRQFAYIQPSTKTRLDVGIQLKGDPGTARLKPRSGMTSHVVAVTEVGQIDDELIGWLEQAWERC